MGLFGSSEPNPFDLQRKENIGGLKKLAAENKDQSICAMAMTCLVLIVQNGTKRREALEVLLELSKHKNPEVSSVATNALSVIVKEQEK